MNFISRGYSALVGEGRSQQDPEQAIQTLVDRVYTSTLIEDKRAAVLSLKGLSREYKHIVGKEALKALMDCLQEEAEDPIMIKALLETLNNLIISDPNDAPENLSNYYAREIVESEAHISKLLELIGDPDFYVRYNALQQIGILFSHLSDLLLSKILTSPAGVGRLVDLLTDSREIVRNEGVQLLIQMTERNTDIQKILAFENSFEKLFNIILDEGGADGNIIVQDCLQLLYNLLFCNPSNQKYFRETMCISKLPELVAFQPENNDITDYNSDGNWREQQIDNMSLILKIIRILVQPDNVDTSVNQNIMQQCGIVSPLLQLSLSIETPCSVRSIALCAIGDIIQSNQKNQSLFQRIIITAQLENDYLDDPESGGYQNQTLSTKKNVPEPAVLVITRLAVAVCPTSILEEYYYSLRDSAAYLVKSYLKDNPDARISIAATFRPPPTDELSENSEFNHSVGSLLISVMTLPFEGLHSSQAVRVWHAISLFSILIYDDDTCKQLALKTQVEKYAESFDVELISALVSQTILSFNNSEKNIDSTHHQLAPANKSEESNFLCTQFLAMLCIWAFGSPESVSNILKHKEFVTFLLEIIAEQAHKKSILCGVASFLFGIFYQFNTHPTTPISFDELYLFISKRIGVDNLVLNLTKLNDSQEIHNAYSDNYENLSWKDSVSIPVHFDLPFASLLRNSVNQTKSILRKTPDSIQKQNNSKVNANHRKESDSKKKHHKNKKSINGDLNHAKKQENSDEINNLKNVNIELERSLKNLSLEAKNSTQQVEILQKDLKENKESYEKQLNDIQLQLTQANKIILELQEVNDKNADSAQKEAITIIADHDPNIVKNLEERLSVMEKEQEDLLTLLAEQDSLCKDYRSQLRSLGQDIPQSDPED
ncbi:hypothetical protein BB561_002661 [Smittium simulii]|uniref:Vesicle tethering protein Uso1/P115-like head domain-containing protein n=1 Tax=Smittium simulii TaxID=133385 RepID=A0A2T9YPR1_9FUNG|nr:hypothetical protein BB561_002661 [Smittium simulii]